MYQDGCTIKFLILSDSAVGKTSMLVKFTENKFEDNYLQTNGMDFMKKYIKLEGEDFTLQIWDTSGQEKFRAITKAYFRGAHGIIIVYDVAMRDSFMKVSEWI